jgi:outer membrane murein-binding lipoprotein Lpp
MTMIRTAGLLAGAATLSISGFAGATDIDNASIDALRTELADLRAQNDALGARVDAQDDQWLNETRATEIRGIVQDVLADSQTRTSLQDSNAMAGYKAGKGFYLSSQDGSFTMKIKGQVQVRWTMNHVKDDPPAGGENQTMWGFGVRRAKVKFSGNVVDPSWEYQVNGAFDSSSGTLGAAGSGDFQLQEAMITKHMDSGLSLTFGQYKAPWTREELVSSTSQLGVDRSVVNEYFNADRAVGIDMMYQQDSWNLEVAYNNGVRTQINTAGERYTNWTDQTTKWAFQGRFQYKFSGDWSDFESFTSSPGDEQAIMLGAAFMGQAYNNQIAGADRTTVWGVTVDASAKFGGLSLFGAFTYQRYNDKTTETKINPYGFLFQGGYSLNDQWEIFGRYSYANSKGLTAGGVPPGPLTDAKVSIITVGVNYFINDNVKFTADFGLNLEDAMTADWLTGNNGWRATNEKDEWVLRAQLQLLF